VSFERVLSEVKARYVVGLTATLQRRDGHHPITEMQLGPVRFAVDPKSHAACRPFEHKLITRETALCIDGAAQQAGIQGIYAALASDESRNALILGDLMRALDEGRSSILLTERRDHLDYFAERLGNTTQRFTVLHGGMRVKERRELAARVAERADGGGHLVLATGRYIGEGFDNARLDTLFLAMPISWKGALVQNTGRLHRLYPGRKEVQVYDYVDREVPLLLRMFEKRLRTYRAIGYARGEAPLGLAEPPADSPVESDEEGSCHFAEDA
jgi:superfamily II DNA or RNA helicase